MSLLHACPVVVVTAAHTTAGQLQSGNCATPGWVRHVTIAAVPAMMWLLLGSGHNFTQHICMLGRGYTTAAAVPVHQHHVLPLCNSRACNYTASWLWQGSTNPALHLVLRAFLRCKPSSYIPLPQFDVSHLHHLVAAEYTRQA